LISNSFILSFFIALIQKIKNLYQNSLTARIVRAVFACIKTFLDNSKIINFVSRRDYYTKVWEHSLLYNIIYNLANSIPKWINKLYLKYETYFASSIFVKFLIGILRRIEILVAAFVALAIIVPHEKWNNIYLTMIALVLATMFFIKIIVHKFEYFNIKALDFALIIFAVVVLISAIFSFFPSLSTRFLVFYATCFIMLLVMVSSLKTERSLNLFIEIVLIGVTFTGLYGIYQDKVIGIAVNPAYTDLITNSNPQGRVFSTLQNPNNFAELLIMMLPFYMVVILNSKKIYKKIAYSLMAIPPLISFIGTGTRAAWIVFLVCAMIFAFFKNKKLIPLLFFAGLLCIPFVPESIYRRIMSLTSSDKSASYRIMIYKTVWPMLKDYWITGVGLGTDTFIDVCENYYQYTKQPKPPPHSHNLYMQIWLETGILGVTSFIWFAVRTVKKCIISLSDKTESGLNNILIAGICGTLGVLAMGIPEYIWFYPRVMFMFWVLVGVILSALSISRMKREGISQKSI